jgi:lysine 2,3-aminomutase
MERIHRISKLRHLSGLTEQDIVELKPVEDKFVFRLNSYYERLIDWDDPDDPIGRLVIPDKSELEEWGELDASEEQTYTKVPGLQHKYRDTALLLINDACAAYCRFCFRKRLFLSDNDEVVRDVTLGMKYITEHQEITNVLLTGGDPLVLPTRSLKPIVEQLRAISHVKIIRIGTKMLAFEPQRVFGDPSFLDLIRAHSINENKIYIMAHFTHPRELTPESLASIDVLQHAGAIIVNQTPMIAGINDRPEVLAELLSRLSFSGVTPYYVFQCRPTLGNKSYTIPLETACQKFCQAQTSCSGLAKRARFVMSHSTGKVEVMAVNGGYVYMKYLQAADAADQGRFMIFRSNQGAYWLDDYLKETNDHLEPNTL